MQYEFLSNNLLGSLLDFLGVHKKSVAFVLLVTLLSWTFGLSNFINKANAASLTFVSDTLSDSGPSIASNHTIVFHTSTGVAAGQTIAVTFPAGFNMNGIDFGDVDLATTTEEITLASSASGNTWGVGLSGQTLTFTSATGIIAAGATTTIEIGTNATAGGTGNTQITNPTAGSYEINIAGTQADSANTRVMILSKVTVTAIVNTSFTFTVAGINAGVGVNGTTTTATSTATTMPFATTTVGVPNTIAQTLSVTTNARNGFVVTVNADQNLTSATGADIDRFTNDTAVSTPIAWASPTGTIAATETGWGHEGITSEDDLNTDEFGTNLWAGNFVGSARQVFSHNGPADGTTANIGLTKVGYQIEISALQEAGNDYTQTLTYVATPTF
jgi:hypothetical protein